MTTYFTGHDKGPYEEYDVLATFDNDKEDAPYSEYVGAVTLPKIISPQDYPVEIEINGVVYYPHF